MRKIIIMLIIGCLFSCARGDIYAQEEKELTAVTRSKEENFLGRVVRFIQKMIDEHRKQKEEHRDETEQKREMRESPA